MESTRSSKKLISIEKQMRLVLKKSGIDVFKRNPEKAKHHIRTSEGWKGRKEFLAFFVDKTSEVVTRYPGIAKLVISDREALIGVVDKYIARYHPNYKEDTKKTNNNIQIPEEYKDLTLNIDSSYDGPPKFFLTYPSEVICEVPSGQIYLRSSGMSERDAMNIARKVKPMYLPRMKAGVLDVQDYTGHPHKAINTYIPPRWKNISGIGKPDSLPPLFRKLVDHLFPDDHEKEYFFSWLYYSLFERSFVYLVLCGAPGIGKNRLQLVLRGLHGHSNTVAGKRTTLSDRFNAQLDNSTLVWFDELHYNMDMENTLKELQNDSISIEKKGVDATRSSQIYASFVISNNKPRDNYIAFDARKFAPLQLNDKNLGSSMTEEEIDNLTAKVSDWNSETFDPVFLRRIAIWIKHNAKRDLFPNLEYKGPMFWKLAHTSMSKWQKITASSLISLRNDQGLTAIRKTKRGYLWSEIEEKIFKKTKGREQLPEYSTVKHFLEVFRDAKGDQVFTTEILEGSIMGDFYVKIVKEGAELITESKKDSHGEEIKEEKFRKVQKPNKTDFKKFNSEKEERASKKEARVSDSREGRKKRRGKLERSDRDRKSSSNSSGRKDNARFKFQVSSTKH